MGPRVGDAAFRSAHRLGGAEQHRLDVHLHYGEDDFAASQALGRVLSPTRVKDMALASTEVGGRPTQ